MQWLQISSQRKKIQKNKDFNVINTHFHFLPAILPRHGWAPDPLMVGIRSPDGLVVGSCTSHPGVLGSIPKREEPGKTGVACVQVPGSSRVPFGIGFKLLLTRSSPSRHPPFTQYPSPSRSLVCLCDGQTSPHKPRLVVPHSTCPSLSASPPANSFIIGPAVINTHNERNQGKQGATLLKYRVPHGSHHFLPHARRVFASSFSTGPPRDHDALMMMMSFICSFRNKNHCHWTVIATKPSGQCVPVQTSGILHGPEEARHSAHLPCTLPLALPFFSPSFFHTISLSPVFISARWAD